MFSVSLLVRRQSSWKYSAYCLNASVESAEPPFFDTEDNGPLMSLVRCAYANPPVATLNVTNKRGSLMKFTPALKSWPRPPLPVTCQEKSSRNCHFSCSVRCGEFWFCPIATLFGNTCRGSTLLG